jgi:hypothetical protein
MQNKPDPATLRGTKAALDQAFKVDDKLPDEPHIGCLAAEADFAALRAQLNDPPPQYADKNL